MEKSNGTLDRFVIKKASTTTKKRKAETIEEIKDEVKVDNKKKKELINDNLATSLSRSFPSFDAFINDLDTWKSPLSSYVTSNKMKNIYNFVKPAYEKTTCYPPNNLIFNAFKETSWDNIKVVIIGQDPYPNPGQAMGLSFSVNRGIKTPKSLVKIYECLSKDKKLNFKTPNHGDLTKWAEQGVLLLNATLTVEHMKANSHQKGSGWEDFTQHVIKTISSEKKGIVFLLWGGFAKKMKKLIDEKKHHVIENIHPSPLAASSGNFADSDQFSKTNELLKKEEMAPIDWNCD